MIEELELLATIATLQNREPSRVSPTLSDVYQRCDVHKVSTKVVTADVDLGDVCIGCRFDARNAMERMRAKAWMHGCLDACVERIVAMYRRARKAVVR